MEGGRAPKVLLLASSDPHCGGVRGRASEGLPMQIQELHEAVVQCLGTARSASESLVITVCDGLDQAFKGIWWMPWH